MITKGNHAYYEQGIEAVLRKSMITYIGTDERKKGLLKNGKKLKNFDLFLQTDSTTYIVDFKGKQFSYPSAMANRWENWIPISHAKDLIHWKTILKGSNCKVTPLLVYLFKISSKEDKKLFKDTYTFKGITYGAVAISPEVYLKNSKVRAKGAVNVSREKFSKLVKPLSYYVPEIKYNTK